MYRTIKHSLAHHFNQAGDTIVEVMFAVAVIGMVIGGSYVIASRALRTGRFAQEQTEALKLAETQLERLKYLASKGTPATDVTSIYNTSGGTAFCVNDTFVKILQTDVSPTGYTFSCKGKGSSGLYDILVTYYATPPAGGTDMFNVTVTWDRADANARGNQQIVYRLHNAPVPSP